MSEDNRHILTNYQKALNELNEALAQMARAVSTNLQLAFKGLIERDTDVCNQVLADDDEIDQLQMTIDNEGMKILTLFQPVASDLRRVVSIMKVANDLERVGDQAANMAKRARKMNRTDALDERELLAELHEKAVKQLEDSVQAFAKGDTVGAVEILKRDAELNTLCKQVSKQLTQRLETDPANAKGYLHLAFMARFLERIGDHAKNICEDAVYMESAKDIRHSGPKKNADGSPVPPA
ncbi:MAG: phosphate transport system protein [Kiritimatiellia bacterium]|jgi:phosphate transport system protein